jgi:hypothetical protein
LNKTPVHFKKPPPSSTQKRKIEIITSSESDSDSDEVHQQVKNNGSGSKDAILMNFVPPGISMAATNNNNKISHANVGKNTTAAAANSLAKAPAVRALNEVS